MKPRIGQVIDGEYRLQDIVGEGASGVVFRAREESLERPVALRMLTRADIDSRSLRRFLSEGRNLAALNHPNVVQIYRLGSHEERPYVAMEYVEGRSLCECVRAGSLRTTDALGVLSQVASGLDAIHGSGALHRNLSCNNVVVTSSGDAKILDPGLFNVADTLTTMGIVSGFVGTIPPVAPEVVRGDAATFASDVFSYGGLLYEVLTGRNPFRADTPRKTLYNILHLDPPSPCESSPDLDPEVGQLALACLSKKPADRPVDLRGAASILARVAGLASTGRIDLPESSTARHSHRNPYMNRAMIRRRADFVGRKREVRRIFTRIDSNPGRSISIVGDRRIGKSSLLGYVHTSEVRDEYLEHPESSIMLFVDLQKESSLTLETFVRMVLEQAEKEIRGRFPVSTGAGDLESLEGLAGLLKEAGMRLVILFDEFERITMSSDFSHEFFSFLRFLAHHHHVVFVISSSRDLRSLCRTKAIASSPFFDMFSEMRLVAFSEEEARQLVGEPSRRAGFPLGAWADDILVHFAGRFPLFLQIACCHFVGYLEEHGPDTEPDREEIERRFREEVAQHFRYVWEDIFDEPQRTVLLHVATGSAIPGVLEPALQELESRGWVERNESGVRAFSRVFADFVLSEGGKVGTPSLWQRVLGASRYSAVPRMRRRTP